MTTFQRGTARREGVINADIGNVWALITDWGNLDWWGNDIEDKDMQAARCLSRRGEGQGASHQGHRAQQLG